MLLRFDHQTTTKPKTLQPCPFQHRTIRSSRIQCLLYSIKAGRVSFVHPSALTILRIPHQIRLWIIFVQPGFRSSPNNQHDSSHGACRPCHFGNSPGQRRHGHRPSVQLQRHLRSRSIIRLQPNLPTSPFSHQCGRPRNARDRIRLRLLRNGTQLLPLGSRRLAEARAHQQF
jgi:hypothetical protein